MLEGAWHREGFVPPIFDRARRAAIEGPGEVSTTALTGRIVEQRAVVEPARALVDELVARQAAERVALKAELRARKDQRRVLREAGSATEPLDQQSRNDTSELRWAEAGWVEALVRARRALAPLQRRLAALERVRAWVSRELVRQIIDTYVVRNRLGEQRLVRELYPDASPPGGAGDCAAPKLFVEAFARGLQPIALAEFWWGPESAGRTSGTYSPACALKCGPLLPFLLEGLEVAAPRRFAPPDVEQVPLPIVFRDQWLVVVEKPAGLLSVPGTDAAVSDSVQRRLRSAFPEARLVHRLDLDTSGVMIAALDAQTHRALQLQFRDRLVKKRYVAWVDGEVAGERGEVSLALRVDLDDRPRQIHDAEHGRVAVTQWEVLGRENGRTRVAFFPLTGRTHQLRVHAAHPLGLGLPIVGDRLYGRESERLMLHAERIELTHPATGELMVFERLAPF